jgi:competence protein ComEC
MPPSKILFLCSISFVLGIFLFSFFKIPLIYSLFLIPLFLIFSKTPKAFFLSLIFFSFFLLGAFKVESAFLKFQRSEILNFKEKKVEILGKVVKEPKLTQNYQELTVKIKSLNGKNFEWEKVLVRTNKDFLFDFGDEIKISGKLKIPKENNLFSFRGYLAKDGILGILYFPKIEKVSSKNFENFWEKFLGKVLTLKRKIKEKIEITFPFPENSLLIAFLFGEEGKVPKEILEKLNFSGLRHLIAVSGQHISVLVSLLLFLFLAFEFWRQQAIFLSIIFSFLFLILVNFQASATRAVLMGSVFLIGQIFGRVTSGLRILTLILAIMLFLNPLSLRYDISFQLSFLAMLGILTLYEPFYHFFRFLPKTFQIREIFSLTLSAQFFVLPLTLYHFGYLSLSSLLSNLLVCPFFPLLLFLLILFSLFCLISKTLSLLVSLPIFVLIYFMETVAKIFSLPGTFLMFKISLPTLVLFYVLLFILAYKIQRSFELRWLK